MESPAAFDLPRVSVWLGPRKAKPEAARQGCGGQDQMGRPWMPCSKMAAGNCGSRFSHKYKQEKATIQPMKKADQSPPAATVAEQDHNSDFESSLSVLESLVDRLESEQLGLDESLRLYEQGMGLAQRCQGMLENARQKVELIRDANTAAEDFDDGQDFV